jgi:hypothetical protein
MNFDGSLLLVDDVLCLFAGRINVFKRVVADLSISIEGLRIFELISPWVRACKPPLRRREVSGPEVIEARFVVAEFAGEPWVFQKEERFRRPWIPKLA